LAPYPKSGNTWLRSIVITLLNDKNEFNLKDLSKITLLSDNKNFTNFANKIYSNDGDLDFDWLTKNIISSQKILNAKNNNFNIYKTHSVRHRTFTDDSVNLGFIYIVRDPRDIVISLSHFSGGSIDRSINELLNSEKLMTRANGAKELISTWELHVTSWMRYQTVPRLIIRYEDLLLNTKQTIYQIADFLKTITKDKIFDKEINFSNIVQNTDFVKLQNQEKQKGFDEASKYSIFFRSGKIEQWKKKLSVKQLNKIESRLNINMKKFKYL
jgi:hypothetical protein